VLIVLVWKIIVILLILDLIILNPVGHTELNPAFISLVIVPLVVLHVIIKIYKVTIVEAVVVVCKSIKVYCVDSLINLKCFITVFKYYYIDYAMYFFLINFECIIGLTILILFVVIKIINYSRLNRANLHNYFIKIIFFLILGSLILLFIVTKKY
jgi:hypothetical protein